MHIPATMIAWLRRQVICRRKAIAAGTTSFEDLAKLHKSEIHTIRYNEIDYIYSDTMALVGGKTVITHENLQYVPYKVRFFYPNTH